MAGCCCITTLAASIIATYDYADQAGKLLYEVCRTEPKDFFQRRPREH
jgi:hypothetical protein